MGPEVLASISFAADAKKTSVHKKLRKPAQAAVKCPDDMDKVYMARDLLIAHAISPPTLTELSRLSGLNEFKLKKGFKEVFHNTVFGYLNDYRLENARTLILDTRKTVSEIAYETGYANPQHFHRAFKKQFGTAPGVLRK